MAAKDEFEAFVIGAVIVLDGDYPKLDEQWKQWKNDNLGSSNKIIHEPNLRKGTGPFYFKGDTTKRALVIQSLQELIAKLDFAAVACVVNRPEYVAQVGLNSLDKSLPINPYLMTLDFLMERLVMVFERQFSGARAHVVAEARGCSWTEPLIYHRRGSGSSLPLPLSSRLRKRTVQAFSLPTYLLGLVARRFLPQQRLPFAGLNSERNFALDRKLLTQSWD